MKDLMGAGCAWAPADLVISDAAVASIFVMSLPDGIAVRFTEYKGGDPGVRVWMRKWFEDRRDKYQRRQKPGEAAEPTAMISLVVERATGGEYALVEARTSSFPAVPEGWPEVAQDELFTRAIALLSSGSRFAE
jgi:hypothetical protein